ncbi:MAG: hypothetical protein HW387_505 [Parachlamydiales bacterium]|nr:hypothetical protein [Parachlamydiales bacterium]
MIIDPLNEIRNILDEFEAKIAHTQTFWEELRELNPSFEQVNEEHWHEKHSKMWLHGGTTPDECHELERWLTDYPPATATANASAKTVCCAWRKWLSIAGPEKIIRTVDYDKKSRGYVERELKALTETFYAEHDKFELPEKPKDESLYDFIVRLARSFEDRHDERQKCELKERKIGDWLEERALMSFLGFIRKNYSSEQVAFIEHIFPQKMDLHFGRIIRLIPLEAYPVPEKTAAEIVIALARRCRNGRSDARHTALESLALSLLCIACSRIRLPKTLEMVRNLQSTAVLSGAEFGVSKNRTFGQVPYWRALKDDDFSVLQVPTWFGYQPLKISNRIATLLKIVARIPSKQPRTTIFQKSRKSLDKMFDLALQEVNPDPKFGNITYLSLLVTQPHIHGEGHRQQPNYKVSK